MELIKAVSLSKTYRQGDKYINAVDDIDIIIDKNRFVSIVGPSGSGKTTFIKVISGLEYPTKGELYIEGHDITEMKPSELSAFRRKKIGFVFQDFNLINIMTAKENIILPALIDGQNFDHEWFDELTDRLGLSDRLDHLPSQLSGGQIQRVAIARALINHPSVIFADEPTGNLDRETSNEIIDLFSQLHNEGNTIVMVTHDEKIADKADTVYYMEDGRLVFM